MPCRDGGPSGPDRSEVDGRTLDERTAQLCEVMKFVEKRNLLRKLSRSIQAWWEQHKEFDRKREAEEAARKKVADEKSAALKKLSPRERRLLNLKP